MKQRKLIRVPARAGECRRRALPAAFGCVTSVTTHKLHNCIEVENKSRLLALPSSPLLMCMTNHNDKVDSVISMQSSGRLGEAVLMASRELKESDGLIPALMDDGASRGTSCTRSLAGAIPGTFKGDQVIR